MDTEKPFASPLPRLSDKALKIFSRRPAASRSPAYPRKRPPPTRKHSSAIRRAAARWNVSPLKIVV
jgi:hypothetical protein